jgi:ribulose-phosphate 3-epimerase
MPDDAVRISPSLMCADQGALAEEVRALEALGADLLHFDLMDGRFAPNLPLGLGVLADLRRRTRLPFDVHLMVEDNDWFVERVAAIGAEQIAVHAESSVHLDRTLALVRERGSRAGVALNPATPLSVLDYVLGRLDFVLLMAVNPGFAGQAIVPGAIAKIADCRAYLRRRGSEAPIAVDGNVSFENIPLMVAAGAGVLVAGSSSLYRPGATRAENFRRAREAIAAGLARRAPGAKSGEHSR